MTRSMTVHALRFTRKWKTDIPLNPRDLDGDDLFRLMENFGSRCSFEETRDEGSQSMLRVTDCRRVSDSELLLKVTQAKWGEPSDVLNPSNPDEVTLHISERDPVASSCRAFCIAPPVGNRALYFSEYSDRSSASYHFLSLFHKDFVGSAPDVKLGLFREFSGKEWLETARVSSLAIEARRKATHIEDGSERFTGKLRLSITPDSISGWGEKLKNAVFGRFESSDEECPGLIDIAEDLGFHVGDDDEIIGKATLEGLDGKKTTVSIDRGLRPPYIRELIQTPSGGPLSDDDFMMRCRDRAATLFELD